MRHEALSLAEIAATLGLTPKLGWEDRMITGVATLSEAEEGDLSFLANPKYIEQAVSSKASAIIAAPGTRLENEAILLETDQAYMLFAKHLHVLEQRFVSRTPAESNHAADSTIDPTAVVSPTAIVESGVEIGPRTEIRAGAKILRGTQIGADCIVDAGAVLGGEGFGWAPDENGHYHRIPQLGNVVLEDHVYIGANTTVDRAALGSTRIGEGSKVDNLCMIAHNVHIGKHTVIAAQTGIAGSTTIGNHCVLAGQVGIAGHLKIGDRVTILAQSGVMSDVSDNTTIFGTPALNHRHYLKSFAAFKKQGE
jgi:UDP-3-O-[3-hydroxymyristoyl] glucosamine N-acyltransferase